ncbi:uncharacterized protein B0H64DRAFT_246612 [Chaetomium fimeti]|uniref:Uncharacterized protein n=1 Tax=Chaetomium fimeti TaxID=1854472 RepID=A0AAE0H7Y0_9PEZI|nr:hypothetical protein B0H64DRAFT_246612 [Chaetomium fimeti]
MLARHHSWATTTSKHFNMHSDSTIRVAMVAGLRTSLVLFRGLHALPAHDLAQAGLLEPQPPKASRPAPANSKMGNCFSQEEKHRPQQNGYAPVPAPAINNGGHSQHPGYKIDPREQREQRQQQYPQSQPQYPQPQQHQQPRPYQRAQQYPQHPIASTSATNARPTGRRRASQQPQSKPSNKKILNEYRIQVTCSDCTERSQDCLITNDLNMNKIDLRRRFAYRDPANAGDAQLWTVSIDFCSNEAKYSTKRANAERVIERFCGGSDRAYDDVGMGSTYGAMGLRSHGWGASRAKAAPYTGPFEVDALLDALDEAKVTYTSDV